MKKIILNVMFIFSSIILTLSCQKAKMNPTQNTKSIVEYDFRTDELFIKTFMNNETQDGSAITKRLNISQLMDIAKIEDEEVRRTAYSLLNLQERLDYWDYLITFKIDNGKFSDVQKQLLIDLKLAVIKPNMFANKNLQEIFRTEYLPLIAGQLKSSGITGDDVDKIFISGSITDIRSIAQPGPGHSRKCVCSTSSMFGCSSCKSTECLETGSGCGFVFWFICNGECGNLLPIG